MKKLINKRKCLFIVPLILVVSLLITFNATDSHKVSANNKNTVSDNKNENNDENN